MCFVLELDFREKEIAGVLSSVVDAASHLTDHDPSKILLFIVVISVTSPQHDQCTMFRVDPLV